MENNQNKKEEVVESKEIKTLTGKIIYGISVAIGAPIDLLLLPLAGPFLIAREIVNDCKAAKEKVISTEIEEGWE